VSARSKWGLAACLPALIAAVACGQSVKPEVRSMTENPVASYPNDAVEVTPGDYLLHREPSARWRVFLVEDIVRLARLVPLRPDGGAIVGLIDEGTTLDSVTPAYQNEVFLLLTAFDRDFASSDEARRAVETGALAPGIPGLARKLGEFNRATSAAFRPKATAPAPRQ
jgi:hypothetical protein